MDKRKKGKKIMYRRNREMVGRERRQRIIREMDHGIGKRERDKTCAVVPVEPVALTATAKVRRRKKD